jgi:hypothetical protein
MRAYLYLAVMVASYPLAVVWFMKKKTKFPRITIILLVVSLIVLFPAWLFTLEFILEGII